MQRTPEWSPAPTGVLCSPAPSSPALQAVPLSPSGHASLLHQPAPVRNGPPQLQHTAQTATGTGATDGGVRRRQEPSSYISSCRCCYSCWQAGPGGRLRSRSRCLNGARSASRKTWLLSCSRCLNELSALRAHLLAFPASCALEQKYMHLNRCCMSHAIVACAWAAHVLRHSSALTSVITAGIAQLASHTVSLK